MFEEEAEEYAQDMAMYYESAHGSIPSQFEKYLRKAVEYGYNKANEWHYPSKGEYPNNRNDVYLLQLEDDNGHTEYEIGSLGSDRRWTCEEFRIRVIAWKEIVLPELPKESE